MESTTTTTTTTASASAGPPSIIEHIVLLNISDDDDNDNPINSTYLITTLNSLPTLLPFPLHLTAGPILRLHSPLTTPTLTFTHLIHARFPSQSHLAQYSSHPAHQSLVSLTRPICLDSLALDWPVPFPFPFPSLSGPISPLPGRAMRVSLYRLRDQGDEGQRGKREVLEELGRIGGKLGASEQFSFGESLGIDGREKGFGVGSVVIFRDLNELDASEEYEDLVRKLIERFKGLIDGFLAVDYVVPRG